ncbi:uncharacterized protein BP5553_04464 [Venustampulla echinocandica]|uniref:Uncharacterized protein n=1 Tax=Venustampulla echinocandica TaxID=2656787 RepID=A0A370TND5_9HELO|nr:uncharacterized protein BP5553_04464 [Venustampulla echinocandica]RDL37031.1 hypothetical protein BP5553_04464 [Venustampulla echinocandica]
MRATGALRDGGNQGQPARVQVESRLHPGGHPETPRNNRQPPTNHPATIQREETTTRRSGDPRVIADVALGRPNGGGGRDGQARSRFRGIPLRSGGQRRAASIRRAERIQHTAYRVHQTQYRRRQESDQEQHQEQEQELELELELDHQQQQQLGIPFHSITLPQSTIHNPQSQL